MNKKDLSSMEFKIYGDLFTNGINDCKGFIQESCYPINEMYWCSEKVDIMSISMRYFKYVEYVDLVNKNIVPFKKP